MVNAPRSVITLAGASAEGTDWLARRAFVTERRDRSRRRKAARRALFTVFCCPTGGRPASPVKEPNQEPTQADFRRRPATPGDCQAWSGAQVSDTEPRPATLG